MNYLLLDPRPQARAEMLALLAEHAPVLGIEVTIPELAQACATNIDPQHTDGMAGYAAIEAVASSVEELRDFQACATVRADLDSVGAMAILSLYQRGIPRTDDMDRTIAMIAAYDRFDHGPWHPGIRPPIDWSVRALNRHISNPQTPLAARVELMCHWLTGDLDLSAEAADAEQHALKAARESRIELRDGIAVVVSGVPSRTPIELGYELAPVVVLSNPAARVQGGTPHQKYSICVWPNSNVLDLAGVLREILTVESGWGGNVNGGIIGSPQGVGSHLELGALVALVRAYLR